MNDVTEAPAHCRKAHELQLLRQDLSSTRKCIRERLQSGLGRRAARFIYCKSFSHMHAHCAYTYVSMWVHTGEAGGLSWMFLLRNYLFFLRQESPPVAWGSLTVFASPALGFQAWVTRQVLYIVLETEHKLSCVHGKHFTGRNICSLIVFLMA